MKHYITIAAIALFTLFSFTLSAQNDKKNDKKVAEVTFVTSIDCPNCVKKVEAKLPFEKGVEDMKVDLKTQTVWIKYRIERTNVEKLAKAIEKLGYTATEKK